MKKNFDIRDRELGKGTNAEIKAFEEYYSKNYIQEKIEAAIEEFDADISKTKKEEYKKNIAEVVNFIYEELKNIFLQLKLVPTEQNKTTDLDLVIHDED